MKQFYKIQFIRYLVSFLFIFLVSGQVHINSQNSSQELKNSTFCNAVIIPDKSTRAPKDIRMEPGSKIPEFEFFNEFFSTYKFSKENQAVEFKTITDKFGTTHTRYKQYYKNLEIAQVQYLLHIKEGFVFHAHGNFVQGIDLDINPAITEEQAIDSALKVLSNSGESLNGSKSAYKLNENVYKKNINSYSSRLMIVCANQDFIAENFRLVYCCSIFSEKPFSNYDVYIDAQTGGLVRKIPRMYQDNVVTVGQSAYNGVVDITISDTDFPEWNDTSFWHLSDWQAYGGSGESWWIADTTFGFFGGYGNRWYEVLESEPISLAGDDPVLHFYHRYKVEIPASYQVYDGWDGMNVRISTDNGVTWQILQDPVPAYTCTSLFSFGSVHGEGAGISGWAGYQDDWTEVVFDLSSYQGETILLRFAFASDPAVSTVDGSNNLYGWQLDNITVSSSNGILFSNDGVNSGFTLKNMYHDVSFIEGNYRLRETVHGKGIATYNALNLSSNYQSVDFVEEDNVINNIINEPGVSVHYTLEKAYEYYLNRHNRLSYNDLDARLIAYANWLFEFSSGVITPNNAMWSGDMMFFGAGDDMSYSSWTAIDIVGHEFTHGVTTYSADLIYENESGALNESFSDIFGTSLEMYIEGPTNGDWIMGEDHVLLMGNIVRSLENPGLLSDPDTYRGYYWMNTTSTPTEENDYGGVHVNCGVQNYWYYLLAHGGSGTNDHHENYSVTGIGIEDAEQIAYRNLTIYLQPASGYYDAARYSMQSAIDLFGENSQQHRSVIDAWNAVGVTLGPKINTTQYLLIQAEVGETKDLNLSVENIGFDTLTIDSIKFTDTSYSLLTSTQLPLDIMSLESSSVYFRITPTAVGSRTDTMIIYSNDTLHKEKKVPLVAVISSPPSVNQIIHPDDYGLQIKPNPFSTNTSIEFYLVQSEYISIRIYNLQGELIRTLSSGSYPAGRNMETWDGSSNQGMRVKPGIYLCVMQSENLTVYKKVILN